MALKTTPFDPSAYLDTPEAIEAYLSDAFDEGDPAGITDALGVVARAKGMSKLAEETGITRAALYKALRSDGNPEFATVLKVMFALGYKLNVEHTPANDLGRPDDDGLKRSAR